MRGGVGDKELHPAFLPQAAQVMKGDIGVKTHFLRSSLGDRVTSGAKKQRKKKVLLLTIFCLETRME